MIPLVITIAAAIALLLYEGYALLTRRQPTITELVRKVFRAEPAVAALSTIGLGVLWLHFLTNWP